MTGLEQQGQPSRARRALRAGAGPVKGGLRRGFRGAVRLTARDDTVASTARRALVLAPHPDDETIGCGATIARRRAAGTEVRVVLATDGRFSHRSEQVSADELAAIRAAEFAEACSRLDVKDDARVNLGFEEGSLGRRLEEVAALIRRQVDDFAPDEILVTSSLDWHDDHRSLSRALHLAMSRPGRTTMPAPMVREYPVWAWADGPWSNPPGRPAVRSALDLVAEPVTAWRAAGATYVRTGPYLTRKRHALDAYRSQLTNLTGEPGWATFDARFLQLFLGDRETFLTPTWEAT
jgi:LmbE family N-acetylglucosaminyl deacetylase